MFEYSGRSGDCICERIMDCSDDVERRCSMKSRQLVPAGELLVDRPKGGVIHR